MTKLQIKCKYRALALGLFLLIGCHVGVAKGAWIEGGVPLIPPEWLGGSMQGPLPWDLNTGGLDNLQQGATSWLVDWTALMGAYSSWSDAVEAAAAAEEAENSSESLGPVNLPIPACCDGDDCFEYLDSLVDFIDRGMTALYKLRRFRNIRVLKARAYQSMVKAAGEFSPLAGAVYHATMLKPVTEAEEKYREKNNAKANSIISRIDAKYVEIGDLIDQQCNDVGWYLKNAWATKQKLEAQFIW